MQSVMCLRVKRNSSFSSFVRLLLLWRYSFWRLILLASCFVKSIMARLIIISTILIFRMRLFNSVWGGVVGLQRTIWVKLDLDWIESRITRKIWVTSWARWEFNLILLRKRSKLGIMSDLPARCSFE
jgi:hypothetical protein